MKKIFYLRILIVAALLAALSVVFKLLGIDITDNFRISFENTPILISGIAGGPFIGLLTGVVADLLGCLIKGYAINPFITVGSAAIGMCSGAAWYFFRKPKSNIKYRIFISVALSHVVGSMLIKSLGMYLYYSTPWSVLIYRVPVYMIYILLDFYVIFLLSKSKPIATYLKIQILPIRKG